MYDFDKITGRLGTGCVKYDGLEGQFGRADLLPLWVADMDFETGDFIVDALRERIAHLLEARHIVQMLPVLAIPGWNPSRRNAADIISGFRNRMVFSGQHYQVVLFEVPAPTSYGVLKLATLCPGGAVWYYHENLFIHIDLSFV